MTCRYLRARAKWEGLMDAELDSQIEGRMEVNLPARPKPGSFTSRSELVVWRQVIRRQACKRGLL